VGTFQSIFAGGRGQTPEANIVWKEKPRVHQKKRGANFGQKMAVQVDELGFAFFTFAFLVLD